MPAGDIHVIDGVKYQLIDAGPGTILGLLHPDKSECLFCGFHSEDGWCNWQLVVEFDFGFPCSDNLFFIKLEEQP